MPDREKVMQWLETCVGGCEEGCPYEYNNLVYRVECKADLTRDALAILKEQEPMEPKWVSGIAGGADAVCGVCWTWLSNHSWAYCPRCGKAVKLE